MNRFFIVKSVLIASCCLSLFACTKNRSKNTDSHNSSLDDNRSSPDDLFKPPVIRKIASLAGVHKNGSRVEFIVTFSKAINVSGKDGEAPFLSLSVGNQKRQATFDRESNDGGIGKTDLVFIYTVQPNDNDVNGITLASTIHLNGGSIRDNLFQDLIKIIPPEYHSFPNVKVDTIIPTLFGVAKKNGIGSVVGRDRNVDLVASFSEPVMVKGRPSLTLNIGTESTASAIYQKTRGSARYSKIHIFRYIVSKDENGDIQVLNMDLNNFNFIRDEAGNKSEASLQLPIFVNELTVETVAPLILGVVKERGVGSVVGTDTDVDLVASFNEPVAVTGSPSLTLNVGVESLVNAIYQKTGDSEYSKTHTFRYTVGEGQNGDIQVVGMGLNHLNRIKDEAGNKVGVRIQPPFSVSGVTVNTVGTQSSSFKKIDIASTHTCALKWDGSVYCWGSNYNGRLGNNNETNVPHPVAVVGVDIDDDDQGDGFLNNIVQISTGNTHTCALKSDGTVYCWGEGSEKQLGNNDLIANRSYPVTVVGWDTDNDNQGEGSLNNMIQISAGDNHTCAIKSDGTVCCWGKGNNGQLGHNSTDSKGYPVAVMGVDTNNDGNGEGFLDDIVQVSAGGAHTCALKSDGTVYCWGEGITGQLGNNISSIDHPIAVVGVDTNNDGNGEGSLSGIVQISSGYGHTCALKWDGTMYCWGHGNDGQLGNNGVTNKGHPVAVVGTDTDSDGNGDGFLGDIVQIDAGISYTCALKSDGTMYCWGRGNKGQLGHNSTDSKGYPVAVVGTDTDNDGNGENSLSDVIQASVGYSHACALKLDGTLYCWGQGDKGQLGNDATTHKDHPVAVVGLDTDNDGNGEGFLNIGSFLNISHKCSMATGGINCSTRAP